MGVQDALKRVRQLIGSDGIVKKKKYWGKTIKVVKKRRKVKKWNIHLDAKRKRAKPPGWRVSKNGRLYFENRVNRSDKPKSKI